MLDFLGSTEGSSFKALIIFIAVFALSAVLLFIARRLAFHYLHKWAARTDTRADDIILESLKHPSAYWAIAIALYIALDTSVFPAKYVGYVLSALYTIIILSVTIAAANIISRLVQSVIDRSTPGARATGLSRAVIRAFIFGIGFLIILNGLGISITPILTALGVGGLAVALALQDTLSNLFAGVHILMEKPIKVGDYIKIASGEEGFVSDIGWRTTRIRELSNNIVIIPNNKLSQSVITNYSLPDKLLALPIKVGISYESDADAVEAILLEEATKASTEVKGIVTEPAPLVRFTPGFADSSIEFTVVCFVEDYADKPNAEHELRKRIYKRFKKEGIEIPYPTRTVRLKKN